METVRRRSQCAQMPLGRNVHALLERQQGLPGIWGRVAGSELGLGVGHSTSGRTSEARARLGLYLAGGVATEDLKARQRVL